MTPPGLRGRRIAIIGNSGSGKSTLDRTLSARFNIAHIELDALNWGPGWACLSIDDPEAWRGAVARATRDDQWVTDGNYSRGALPQILPRATDVIWLDFLRGVIMARVIRRSVLRALSGQELWPGTGNRLALAAKRPSHPLDVGHLPKRQRPPRRPLHRSGFRLRPQASFPNA